jgi:hypothetical protein
MIYKYTFGGHVIQLGNGTMIYHVQTQDQPPIQHFTTLATTCRQIHLESNLYIFTHNEFGFLGTGTSVGGFLANIQQRQLATISAVRVWFPKIGYRCDGQRLSSNLGSFTGLQRVTTRTFGRQAASQAFASHIKSIVGQGVEVVVERITN